VLSPAQKLYRHPVQDSAHRRAFSQEWQHKAGSAEQQAETTWQSSAKYYNQHGHSLTEIGIGSNEAIQNPRTKLFLRRHVPLSIPTHITQDCNADQTTQDLSAEQTTQELFHSVRTRQQPSNRLIKDPTWH